MKVPYYVVSASVAPGNRVTSFHDMGPDSASVLLTDFERFRYGSFDVAIPGRSELGPDDSLELRWEDRKVLRLYQDGTLLFRARADSDFLGWGVEPHAFPKFPKLEPLVVVEVNTSFVYRYRAVLKHLKHPATQIYIRLHLHDFVQEDLRLFLTRYFAKGNVDWEAATRYVVQTDEESLEVSAGELIETPNRVAFKVVAAFTSMFDMPEEYIPFVKGEGDEREIDLEGIRSL